MRYDVFISYSSIDQKIAEGVCAYLEQQGIRCFVAYRDIPRGVVWATAIVEALENSRMMVVLFSKNFNDSSQVEREIELASNMEMPILTFRLSDVAFRGAKKYYLQNLNWIDAFPNPERSFGALYGNVVSLLGIAVSGGGKGVKKDSPISHESNKSNRFLWIVIACLSVALVVVLVYSNRTSSEPVFVDDTDEVRVDKVENNTQYSNENVGEIFSKGTIEFKNKNYSEAVKYFRKAAEQGHALSQSYLGVCYYEGNGVSKNESEAVKWYRKAAEQGERTAQFNLGNCYYYGIGVSKDLLESVKWFKRSAEQGVIEAQCKLGVCYYEGNGVSKDVSEAVKWFKKSAEQGNAEAQSWVGYCYENGSGVKKEISEAFKWYKKSAEQGYAFSQNRLGVFYHEGISVSKDFTEAFKWFKKSAEQGNAEAQSWMGYCYENGSGVKKEISEAFKWYKKSAEQGNEYAKNALERLEKQ